MAAWLLGWCVGLVLQWQQAALWPAYVYGAGLALGALASLIILWAAGRRAGRRVLVRRSMVGFVALALLGFSSTGLRALHHQADLLLPSLEERREDIPELTRHFIEMLHRTQGLVQRELTSEAEAMLQTMHWPGNVRQLRNVIERVLILGDGSGPIEARELPGQESTTDLGGRLVLGGAMATLPLREAREVFEREYLLTQINRFGGNISRTAGFVGMERSALHRKLKSLGVVGNNKGADRDDGHDDMNGDDGQFMG